MRERGRKGYLKDVHVFIHKCTLHCKVFSCDMYMQGHEDWAKTEEMFCGGLCFERTRESD